MARPLYTHQLADFNGNVTASGVTLVAAPAAGTVVVARAYSMQMTPYTPGGFAGPALLYVLPAVHLAASGKVVPIGSWQPGPVDPQDVQWEGSIAVEAPNSIVLAQFGFVPTSPIAVTIHLSGWILVPS